MNLGKCKFSKLSDLISLRSILSTLHSISANQKYIWGRVVVVYNSIIIVLLF